MQLASQNPFLGQIVAAGYIYIYTYVIVDDLYGLLGHPLQNAVSLSPAPSLHFHIMRSQTNEVW